MASKPKRNLVHQEKHQETAPEDGGALSENLNNLNNVLAPLIATGSSGGSLKSLDQILNGLLTFQISNLMPDLDGVPTDMLGDIPVPSGEAAASDLSLDASLSSTQSSLIHDEDNGPPPGDEYARTNDSEAESVSVSSDVSSSEQELVKLDLTAADDLYRTMTQTDPDTAAWLKKNYPALFSDKQKAPKTASTFSADSLESSTKTSHAASASSSSRPGALPTARQPATDPESRGTLASQLPSVSSASAATTAAPAPREESVDAGLGDAGDSESVSSALNEALEFFRSTRKKVMAQSVSSAQGSLGGLLHKYDDDDDDDDDDDNDDCVNSVRAQGRNDIVHARKRARMSVYSRVIQV